MTKHPKPNEFPMTKSESPKLRQDLRYRASSFALRASLGIWVLGYFVIALLPAAAQWKTQSVSLQPGWNAVYLHVDASHVILGELTAGTAIGEIWLWQPTPTSLQFIENPQASIDQAAQWKKWDSGLGPSSDLKRLPPNAAVLVNLTGAAPQTWNILGKAVMPNYSWTSTGLNFIGFSTPESSPPNFENFLAPAPALRQGIEVFRYPGGALGTGNPLAVPDPALAGVNVIRGEAFWIRNRDRFNDYFGPFEVIAPSVDGLHFDNESTQQRLRLRNHLNRTNTITMRRVDSAVSPVDPGMSTTLGLLTRGELNVTNLTYAYANLSSGQTWTLAPKGEVGSEVEIVLAADQTSLTNPPHGNAQHGAILRVTDADGLLQIDVPVTATRESATGLWIGQASVTEVRASLKTIETDSSNKPIQDTNGTYVVSQTITNFGKASSPMPLRLILHHDGFQTRLLQRVFHGPRPGSTNVLTTAQSVLDPARLNEARRVSVAHLPWSRDNTYWPLVGLAGPDPAAINPLSLAAQATVNVSFDDYINNPFLHTYHPDHDNLDADFERRKNANQESYGIQRIISFSPDVTGLAPDHFAARATSRKTVAGNYHETITVAGKTYQIQGHYQLNKISSIPDLITP